MCIARLAVYRVGAVGRGGVSMGLFVHEEQRGREIEGNLCVCVNCHLGFCFQRINRVVACFLGFFVFKTIDGGCTQHDKREQ